MSKIGSIAWAALIIAVGSNSLLNAQSLKSTIYHQEGWDNCGAKTCVTEVLGGTSTSIEGTFFRPVTSSDHDSLAQAEASFRPSEEFKFAHPKSRLLVENRGGTGGSDRMYAVNKIIDNFLIKPYRDLVFDPIKIFPIQVESFRLKLYDRGVLYAPPLRKFFHSKQYVKYRRDFRVDAVRTRGSSSQFGFVADTAHTIGDTKMRRSVRGYDRGRAGELQIAEPTELSYSLLTAFVFEDAPDGLLLEYTYSNSLEIDNPATFKLDSSTTAYGNFINTSGISGLALFDENGQDVTRFFEITNSAGTLLFGVPEPSSLLLSLTAFACAFLRRYR